MAVARRRALARLQLPILLLRRSPTAEPRRCDPGRAQRRVLLLLLLRRRLARVLAGWPLWRGSSAVPNGRWWALRGGTLLLLLRGPGRRASRRRVRRVTLDTVPAVRQLARIRAAPRPEPWHATATTTQPRHRRLLLMPTHRHCGCQPWDRMPAAAAAAAAAAAHREPRHPHRLRADLWPRRLRGPTVGILGCRPSCRLCMCT